MATKAIQSAMQQVRALTQRSQGCERDATGKSIPRKPDLENGFGDVPEMAAETIRLAAAAGAVGGSIEDATGRVDDPIYELAAAVDRIAAASAAAASLLPFSYEESSE